MTLNSLTEFSEIESYLSTRNQPEGIEKEEISFTDSTPAIRGIKTAYIMQILNGASIPIYFYGPNIESKRHINTELLLDGSKDPEEETSDKISLAYCFALKGVKEDSYSSYKYPFIEGSVREYDFKHTSQWGQFNLYVNSMDEWESLPGFNFHVICTKHSINGETKCCKKPISKLYVGQRYLHTLSIPWIFHALKFWMAKR